jgi:hypothetical protein
MVLRNGSYAIVKNIRECVLEEEKSRTYMLESTRFGERRTRETEFKTSVVGGAPVKLTRDTQNNSGIVAKTAKRL